MKTIAFLLIFLLQFTSFTFAQNEAKYQELEDTADQEILYGNFEKAISIYKGLVENNYEKSRMYSQIGLCYFYLKNYPKSKENFKLSLLYNEKPDATAYANVGAAYSQMDDYENALEYNMKALKIEVNSQTVSNAIAVSNNMGKYEQAENIYNKYVKGNIALENDDKIACVMGRAYFNLGKYFESAVLYREFFDSYYPQEKFPVDIWSEKELYLRAMINAASEGSCLTEGYEKSHFPFNDEIEEIYNELTKKYGSDKYFDDITLLGYHIILNNPESTKYFRQLLSDHRSRNFLDMVEVKTLSGDFNAALSLLEKNRNVNYDEELTKEQRHFDIESNIFSVKLAKYVTDLILYANPDKDLQKEIISASKIFSESKKEDYTISAKKAELVMNISMCAMLYGSYSRTDQDDFIRRILMTMEKAMDAEKANRYMEEIRENGIYK